MGQVKKTPLKGKTGHTRSECKRGPMANRKSTQDANGLGLLYCGRGKKKLQKQNSEAPPPSNKNKLSSRKK